MAHEVMMTVEREFCSTCNALGRCSFAGWCTQGKPLEGHQNPQIARYHKEAWWLLVTPEPQPRQYSVAVSAAHGRKSTARQSVLSDITMKFFIKLFVPDCYWKSLSWWRLHFGIADALRTHARLLYAADGLLRVKRFVNGREVNLYLRPGTSDLDVFEEIFVQNEYAAEIGKPGGIVDAGAHIGLATVYLATRFPDATIVALEPEPLNYQLLCRNVAALDNVVTVEAGLWSQVARVKVVDPGHSSWGFRVVEVAADDPAGMPAIGVADAIDRLRGKTPVALKIDIEGAEVEALSSSAQWLCRVDAIIIELHDRFRPGCSAALDRALADHEFSRSTSGENVVVNGIRLSSPVVVGASADAA